MNFLEMFSKIMSLSFILCHRKYMPLIKGKLSQTEVVGFDEVNTFPTYIM
jgi:hypothetical protein